MKKLILTLFVFSSLNCTSQINNFDLLVEKNKENLNFSNKLNIFKENGIELSLQTDSLKPQQLIDTAKSFLGTPHCMGGIDHSCIDCSGLLYICFKKNGINVPHNSEEISRYGKIILDIDSLMPGDLVFFINTYKTEKFITHAGIYIGSYQFVHTSASKGVVVSDIRSSYYKEHYIFSTRIFY